MNSTVARILFYMSLCGYCGVGWANCGTYAILD